MQTYHCEQLKKHLVNEFTFAAELNLAGANNARTGVPFALSELTHLPLSCSFGSGGSADVVLVGPAVRWRGAGGANLLRHGHQRRAPKRT
jgi:hypothetical protein